MQNLAPHDRVILETMIDRGGMETTWKSLLRAYVRGAGKQFSYISDTPELRGSATASHNLLGRLSIGEISILYEYSLAYRDRASRKDAGQYFTPDDVSQFLAKQARHFTGSLTWVDPCAGVGNLSYWLARAQAKPEDFLLRQLYLVDTDALALLIARILLTVAFQSRETRLFGKLARRFLNRDFLKATDLPRFDAAILNPPYVSGVYDEAFETAATRNLYAYFLERVARLCPAGYISITPQTFTNASSFSSLRRTLIAAHQSLTVYCFDNVPDNIFSGVKFGSGNTNRANSTRAGVILARYAKKRRHQVTPLLRWRSHERAQMLAVAHTFLTETTFTERVFPKVGRELRTLYNAVHSLERLERLIATEPTRYRLQVPTTPRYFISANKQPVRRTSFKTLYFRCEEDLNRTYLILNSSYTYWWWRVHDGGMTISEKTLLDLPLPEINQTKARQLVRELERSERASKVVKMNAGKAIENIKHSSDLVRALTQFLFPQYATDLSATHANSCIGLARRPLTLSLGI